MTSVLSRERTGLAVELQVLRRRKRFSVKSLERAAGVSGTYIAALEQGYDPRTGKEIRPSPDVLRHLADALGDGDDVEADRIYGRLMRATGYLRGILAERSAPYESVVAPSVELIARSIRQQTPELAEEDKEAFIRLIKRSRQE